MLPYKTTPKCPTVTIGAEDIGELELPVLYGLTVNERQYIDEQTKDLPDTQKLLISFAERLSKELSKLQKDDENAEELGKYSVASIANEIATGISDTLRKYIYAHHQKEFEALRDAFAERNKAERAAYASAMIIYRLGVSGWEPSFIDDPEKIRPPLVDELYQFAVKEELGFRDPKNEKYTDETVGKSETKSAKAQTGRSSSGN
jgi:hypothetical protein